MEVDGAGASVPVEARGCTGECTCERTGTLTCELPLAVHFTREFTLTCPLTWVTRMEAPVTRVKQKVYVWR